MESSSIIKLISKRLTLLRIKSGLTESEICKRLHLPEGQFTDFEKETASQSIKKLERIAKMFEIDLPDFFIEEGSASIAELKEEIKLSTNIIDKKSNEILQLQKQIIKMYNKSGGDKNRPL